jgi:hypothetical protein
MIDRAPGTTADSSRDNSAQSGANPVTLTGSGLDPLDEANRALRGKIVGAVNAGGNTADTRNYAVVSNVDLRNYLWNLPPHQWSLPVEPRVVDPLVVNTSNFDPNSSSVVRRGRIYYYSRVENVYKDKPNTGQDPRYGFQFMWNPSEVYTQVSVNMDITPTSNDKFAKVVGAFPSGESLSLSVRLDRTNDFFCIRSLNRSKQSQQYADLSNLAGYYSGNNSFEKNFTNNVNNKIQDLQTRGTISDLEYLYKAINGPGWTNAATGIETSDIGFLRPTLLRIDIGPLSYIGYVTNIGVNHTSFTRAMVPMRTDVALNFNLMATAGLATSPTVSGASLASGG